MGLKKWRNLVLKKWDLFNSPIVDNCWQCPAVVAAVVVVEGCWTRHCCGNHLGSALTWSLAARSGRPFLLSSGCCGPGRRGQLPSQVQRMLWRCGDKLPGRAPLGDCSHGVPTAAQAPHHAAVPGTARTLATAELCGARSCFLGAGASSAAPLQTSLVSSCSLMLSSLKYWYIFVVFSGGQRQIADIYNVMSVSPHTGRVGEPGIYCTNNLADTILQNIFSNICLNIFR